MLGLKFALGVLSIGLGTTLGLSQRVAGLSEPRFRLLVWGIWSVTRVGLFVLTFWLLGQTPSSDVAGYYFPQGLHALNGEVVYRDFSSSYAPLFPYLLALFLMLRQSPIIIVGVALVAEGCALALWIDASRPILSVRTLRRATLFYVASALPIANVAIEGQNQVLVALCFGLAMWLLIRRSVAAAAFAACVPVLSVKILALLGAPAFVPWSRLRSRALLAYGAGPVLVYGGLLASGVDVFQPLRLESADQTSGNVPFLMGTVLGAFGMSLPPRVLDAVTLIAIAATMAVALRSHERLPTAPILSLVLVFSSLMLASKKAYSSYLVMVFFPVCIVAALSKRTWLGPLGFGAFGFAGMIERSLWFRWYSAARPERMFAAMASGGALQALAFLSVELLLVGVYLTLCRDALMELARVKSPAVLPSCGALSASG